jgi:fructosamine-3-kinase
MWQEIVDRIAQSTGQPFRMTDSRSVGGGCINQSYLLSGNGTYFVKLNKPALLSMFEAEALGLQEIADTQSIAIPEVICWGTTERHSYLVLAHLDLGGAGSAASWHQMGADLAGMHRWAGSERFGWQRPNTIGSTPQINSWSQSWPDFFREQRLGYQFQLAGRGVFPQAQQLLDCLPQLLSHQPRPSLVHGDLWSGNAGFLRDGQPVIFDPATYWGDREVDLAMTELFGGFPAAFYQGYNAVYPLDQGYDRRKVVYNLYHLLNHYNLFGGSYQGQANHNIEQAIALAAQVGNL